MQTCDYKNHNWENEYSLKRFSKYFSINIFQVKLMFGGNNCGNYTPHESKN